MVTVRTVITTLRRLASATRVLDLRVRPLLRLRQKGNPIESDRQGTIDGKDIYGDEFEYYEALMASMRKHGLREPIQITALGGKPHLYEGHHRLSAAWELGWDTIPTEVDSTISDDQLRALELLLGYLPACPS